MSIQGWIGVDLDGTVAEYNGWVSEEHIGSPIPAMRDRVLQWLAEGRDVRIFTARVDGGEVAISMGNEAGQRFRDVQRIRGIIEAWCREHLGKVIPITNKKDYGMIELWDDRCVQVVPNTGAAISGIVIQLESELAALREDRERLDWLDGPDGSYQAVMHILNKSKGTMNFRQSIDAAHAATKREK